MMTYQTNSMVVDKLEPRAVWQFFADIAAIPRCSKKEEPIRRHVRDLALGMGFAVREDAAGNLVIEVPATPGYEEAPVAVIQCHLDMVCEKNRDTEHDFDHDPIRLIVDQDDQGHQIVRANGTTLGADNGIGLAMGLAAASLPEVKHGPLELLCTVDEERGMTGAKALESDFFQGKRMLNLDSEEDHIIYIGCAGGCDVTLTWQFERALPTAGHEVCQVAVTGLKGGHSGGDIHLNRVNAIKLLSQVLWEAGRIRCQLVDIHGGSVRNVIPREASATVAGPAGIADAIRQAAQRVQEEAVRDRGEENCTIRIEQVPTQDGTASLSIEDTQRVLTSLAALPHGVLAVVPEIAGLVQTSNNLATIHCESSNGVLRVQVGCLARSSSRDLMHATVRQIEATGRLGGATVAASNEYPGWKPNLDSPLLATCRRIYAKLFGAEPDVTAIHAGLECGIIGERMGGGLDTVSFGPHIEGAHSPDERIWVASVQKSWTFLQAVLAELAEDIG